MTTAEIHEILTSLGYTLQDRGNYWQTNAMFRQGDNKTAIQIYKDTGVWRDYVNNTPPSRFERLVEKSAGSSSDLRALLKNKDFSSLFKAPSNSQPKLSMETIYEEDCLKKLLPHYRFYNDRGVPDKVLKELKGGLATQGQLYQRFVFPIYNEFGQIHGFSGRDMLNKEGRPKWKHTGKKSTWIYPAYVPRPPFPILKILEDSEDLILVESIGDLLALHAHGIYNVLVTFGLDVSPSILSFLPQLNSPRLILSFNNDSSSSENRGLQASVKNYLKLLSHSDPAKICICLPVKNDFGDMTSDCFEKWRTKLDNINIPHQQRDIVNAAHDLASEKKLSPKAS